MVTMTADSTLPSNATSGGSPVPPDTTSKKTNNDNRRSNKPIMEKRRRARINNCLNELKSLILDAMKKDPARHSKLEKADILEMTVKHLETMHRRQMTLSAASDPHVLNKFRAGFSECAGEVGRFPGLDPAVRRRLLQHLSNCLSSNSEPSANSTATEGALPQEETKPLLPTGMFLSAGAQSVQLVPTRLPNGDIALVLPSNCSTPRQMVASSGSSSSSSTSPLPMLVPISSPTVSTSNRESPIDFDKLCVSIPHPEPNQHTSVHCPNDEEPGPLSLVMKKLEPDLDEERPWRPW